MVARIMSGLVATEKIIRKSKDKIMENIPKNPLENHYDKIYSETDRAFGGESGEPESMVVKLPEYLQGGSILELGAGQGRNGLWLARKGFKVEAVDISSVGVERMNQIADAEKLDLHAIKADSRDELEGLRDAIVSTYMLHHLTREEALQVIEKMKNHTRPLGFNLVTAFTSEGDFFKKDPTTNRFYPNLGELKALYEDWEILEYEESNSRARAKKEDGSPMFNIAAKLLAKKPENTII